jgi:hypothetical protein
MTHRARLEGTTWPYVVTRWDATYEEIATRYEVDYDELVEANRGALDATSASAHPTAAAGTVVRVPVPIEALDFEWERFPVAAGTTLDAVCEERNGTAARTDDMTTTPEATARPGAGRIRPPQLTPAYLWELVLNNDFRRQYLEENEPAGGVSVAEVAADGSMSLAADAVLMIPWLPRAIGRPILIAPDTAAAMRGEFGASFAPDMCTTCDSVPDWVDELYVDFIVPMGERLESLRADNRRYGDRVRAYLRELGHLHVIDLLVGVMAAEPGAADVTALQTELAGVHQAFTDWMGEQDQVEVEVLIGEGIARRRRRSGRYLLDKLQSPRFNELVRTAFVELEWVVNERETTRTRICGLVADVCAQVMRVGSLEEELDQIIDRALEAHAAAACPERVSPVLGANALETLMSLGASNVGVSSAPFAGTLFTVADFATRVGTTLVGNLPGPPSLAGALLSLRLATDVRAISSAVRGIGVGPLTAIEALRVRQLATYAQLDEAVLRAELGAARTQADVDALAERIGGRFQSGPGWCSALAIIAFIGVIHTAQNPPADPFAADPAAWTIFAANLASGSMTTFSGVVGMIVRFGEGGAAEALCLGLGRFCAVLMVLTAVVEGVVAFRRGDTGGVVLSFFTAVGGILVFCPGPWAVAGLVVITATILVPLLLDRVEGAPDSRRAVKGLLRSLREQPRLARVLANVDTLATSLEAFESYVDESDAFITVVEWSDNMGGALSTRPRVARTELRAHGVSDTVIDAFVTRRVDPTYLIR